VTTALEYKKAIGYVGSIFLIGLGSFFVFFKKVNLGMDAEGNKLRFRKRDFFKSSYQDFSSIRLTQAFSYFGWLMLPRSQPPTTLMSA
jgi:hypothetical protein